MKVLLQWLKNLSSTRFETLLPRHLLSHEYREKREYTRARFPIFLSTAFYPKFYYATTELKLINLSVGGLCTSYSKDIFLNKIVGDQLTLECMWSLDDPHPVPIQVKIVGKSLQQVHCQFLSLPITVYSKVVDLCRVAQAGQRLKPSTNDFTSHLKIEALEFWYGQGGESLILRGDSKYLAELTYCDRQFVLWHDRLEESHADSLSQTEPLSYALIYLCNISTPSENVKTLIYHIAKLLTDSHKKAVSNE